MRSGAVMGGALWRTSPLADLRFAAITHLPWLQPAYHVDVAIVHSRMDEFETCLDRIERRLDLRDEAGYRPASSYITC